MDVDLKDEQPRGLNLFPHPSPLQSESEAALHPSTTPSTMTCILLSLL